MRAQLDPMVAWNRSLRLYYFPADRRTIERTIRYRSVKNDTTRMVVKAKRRKDGSISYVRHSAFSGEIDAQDLGIFTVLFSGEKDCAERIAAWLRTQTHPVMHVSTQDVAQACVPRK